MKKCAYGGLENPENAPNCAGCGQESEGSNPVAVSAEERRSGGRCPKCGSYHLEYKSDPNFDSLARCRDCCSIFGA